jgi:ribosome modulation factor
MSRLEAEREGAWLAGKVAGNFLANGAHTCPYTHDQGGLRMAWLDGFSQGRAELAKGPTPPRGRAPRMDAERPPARVGSGAAKTSARQAGPAGWGRTLRLATRSGAAPDFRA